MKLKKKSLLANITSIASKIKDSQLDIFLDKEEKIARLKMCSAIMWEELEPISNYCILHNINWKICIIENSLTIKIWEENE